MGVTGIFIPVLAFQLYLQGHAYPFGPPGSSCIDGYPHHINDKLVGPSPFIVWADRTTYSPGDNITVTVTSAADHVFRGIVVRAHLPEGERLRLLGEFFNPPNGTKLVSWYAEQVGMKSCLTHSDSRNKHNLILSWRAPSDSHGDIRISVDLVEDFERTWADHYIILKAEVEANTNTTFPFEVQEAMTGLDQTMHWAECGVERGCVLYPHWCTGSDCDFAVTYQPIRNGQWLEFEVMGGTDDFVAVGFSEDKLMGGTDSGFACVMTKFNEANFLHGLLPAYFFLPHIAIDYRSVNVQRINSRIYCRFIRPINITAPYRFLNFNTISDLTKDYHIYVAFGHVYKGTTAMDQHTALPLVSKGRTNLFRPDIVRVEGLTTKIKVHGILNSLAWLGLIGIGSIIAKHYKGTFTKTVGGSPLWFQVHRGLQIIGGVLSIIAIIIIFTTGWTKKAPVHAVLGLVTIGMFLLQSVVALCRPAVDSKRHYIFRSYHSLMALGTLALAATTIFLGVMVKTMPPTVTRRCVIVIIVTLVIYLLWYIAAMATTCSHGDDKEEENKKNNGKRAEKASLFLGVLAVAAGVLTLAVFIGLA